MCGSIEIYRRIEEITVSDSTSGSDDEHSEAVHKRKLCNNQYALQRSNRGTKHK